MGSILIVKAIVHFSDGLSQFIHVQEYESYDGTEVELPSRIELRRENQVVKVMLHRILGREWNEVPEYIEQAS